jgi:hypothetical protein
MSFKKFAKEQKQAEALPTATDAQLLQELENRDSKINLFPLDVFHENLKPLLEIMYSKYDLPRSYIGLSMLSAYSTAIGTAYVVKSGVGEIYLPVWACLTGISSSGKSLAIGISYKPIFTIQDEFDEAWEIKKAQESEGYTSNKMDTIIFRDTHIPTLVRDILPDNPKGVAKDADELMEWINGMNSYSKKEGTDEQFWISSWNCKSYSGMRSGKNKFVLPAPFVNVYGGVQPSILYKLFKNDRATTGFIFRLLFASPTESRIAEPDITYIMPEGMTDLHHNAIRKLFFELPVTDMRAEPKRCIITEEAMSKYISWTKKKTAISNAITDIREREISSSILGKIKEYALRFSGILHLMDKALSGQEDKFSEDTGDFPPADFNDREYISKDTMKRALKLADYFYQSAADTYKYVDTKITAPPEVLIAANLFKAKSSFSQIAKAVFGDEKLKTKAYRAVQKWIKDYPKQFGAET